MLLNRIKTLLQINDNDELIYEIVEITKEKRINTEITRKVCLVALTDSTKAVKITIA